MSRGAVAPAPSWGVSRLRSGGWSPLQLAGTQLFLDADRPGSTWVDGQPVGSWAELRFGRTPTQGVSAAKPTARLVAGRWWLEFVADDCLVFPASALGVFRNVASYMILAGVSYPLGTAVAETAFNASNGLMSSQFRALLGRAPTGARLRSRRLDAVASATLDGGSAAAGTRIESTIVDHSQTLARVYQGTGMVAENLAWLTAGTVSNTDSVAMHVGAVGGASAFANCLLRSLLVVSPAPSASNFQRTVEWAARHAGL